MLAPSNVRLWCGRFCGRASKPPRFPAKIASVSGCDKSMRNIDLSFPLDYSKNGAYYYVSFENTQSTIKPKYNYNLNIITKYNYFWPILRILMKERDETREIVTRDVIIANRCTVEKCVYFC